MKTTEWRREIARRQAAVQALLARKQVLGTIRELEVRVAELREKYSEDLEELERLEKIAAQEAPLNHRRCDGKDQRGNRCEEIGPETGNWSGPDLPGGWKQNFCQSCGPTSTVFCPKHADQAADVSC